MKAKAGGSNHCMPASIFGGSAIRAALASFGGSAGLKGALTPTLLPVYRWAVTGLENPEDSIHARDPSYDSGPLASPG
jgi:hypothetical protein